MKDAILEYVKNEYLDEEDLEEMDLETKYSIKIPDDQASPAAFDTVTSIINLVNSIKKAD